MNKFYILIFLVAMTLHARPLHAQENFTDLQLDGAFGNGGLVTTNFGAGPDEIYALALLPDGKILALGTAVAGGNLDFALSRYHPDGKLDLTFGTQGKVTTDIFNNAADQARDLLVMPDVDFGYKILVIGFTQNFSNNLFDIVMARYCPDGKLDDGNHCGFPPFGPGGIRFYIMPGTQEHALSVAQQTDEKLVLAGYVVEDDMGADPDFLVIRALSDGSLDPTFGAGGKVVTNFGFNGEDVAHSVLIQEDGKILVGGNSNFDFALARYCEDGSLDNGVNCGIAGFGTGGMVTNTFGGLIDESFSMIFQSNGNILLGGTADPSGTQDFAMASYLSEGELDLGFGNSGGTTTDFNGNQDVGLALALSPNEKILLAGRTGGDFALARYLPDGTLDLSLNFTGKLTTDFFGEEDGARALLVLPDGKVLLGGYATQAGKRKFALAQYIPVAAGNGGDGDGDGEGDGDSGDGINGGCSLHRQSQKQREGFLLFLLPWTGLLVFAHTLSDKSPKTLCPTKKIRV